ncbi:DoxX family membrane protein [uncultured Fibrella sp.]|uniref:DoxX family membrane protein n=1 Tax=uncultured Fibrella sp. TaxID=1284596 RepID=UPI0035CB89E5
MNFFNRFDQLDTTVNRWLVENSSTLLRICTGVVFLEFGLIKFFYGSSPVEGLATYVLTGGLLTGGTATHLVALLECITGACFLSSRSIRLVIWLLGIQLLGALVPFVFFSNELILSLFNTPTLVVQYMLTEIVLVATGLFIAVNWNKTGLGQRKPGLA